MDVETFTFPDALSDTKPRRGSDPAVMRASIVTENARVLLGVSPDLRTTQHTHTRAFLTAAAALCQQKRKTVVNLDFSDPFGGV